MRIVEYPDKEAWKKLCSRPVMEKESMRGLMEEIFGAVRKNGDEAIKLYTEKFDRQSISILQVTDAELREAADLVAEDLKKAMALAKENIEKFHSIQVEKPVQIETAKGVFCWRESRAIEKVGLYIPGGTAPLFSTVLMLAIPAKIAGCEEVIICTPAGADGKINPAILYAAKLCGIRKIFKIGGAQAIAAMSLGTESVPKVFKIFGPGNQYVNEAKIFAQQMGTAIDLPAGPSEVLVIADETAEPAFVAADLLSQAEHGEDSQVIFLTTNPEVLQGVILEIRDQLPDLPRRLIAERALENSIFIQFKSIRECLEFSNEYAPEHLILSVENAETHVNEITNAGSVFMGNYSPESAGDYASGTNHTLPTNAAAKAFSGVSVDSFIKKITIQKITREGIANLGPAIQVMAEAEGLLAHKNAVSVRLKNLSE